MSTSWSATGSTSTSSSASTWGSDYRYYYGYERRKSARLFGERPLKTLVEAENTLKEEIEKPLEAMPKEPFMFDPKELVLGGETGWKRFQPKKQ